MSFDILVQGFERGESRETDATALRCALAPYLVGGNDSWNLHTANSTAEIYGVETLASGFTLTHIDGIDLYDVVVEIAAAFDLVIMPASALVAITRDEQRGHLPEELRELAVRVTTGAELLAAIKAS